MYSTKSGTDFHRWFRWGEPVLLPLHCIWENQNNICLEQLHQTAARKFFSFLHLTSWNLFFFLLGTVWWLRPKLSWARLSSPWWTFTQTGKFLFCIKPNFWICALIKSWYCFGTNQNIRILIVLTLNLLKWPSCELHGCILIAWERKHTYLYLQRETDFFLSL